MKELRNTPAYAEERKVVEEEAQRHYADKLDRVALN